MDFSCRKRLFLSIRAILLYLALAGSWCAAVPPASKIPTPSEFLGFEVGADRKLADYNQIVSYFKALAAASKRIEIQNLGPSTLGNDLIQAVISSEENLKNKSKYREIARKLADPRGISESERQELVRQGKVILLISCNIHASEIGSTQMVMEWAHALITAQDKETRQWLEDVILLLIPSLNPDGQLMEVEWYRKYLGTPYEGGRMPWLYHPYVGHDNNRDWVMLTQKESKVVNHSVYFEWFPQVWLDEHQMGYAGPRMFVPPYTNPVADKLHPVLWRVVDHMGTLMSWRLEQQKKSGVIYSYLFDAYWPGGTKNTAWWKNVFGLLTEVASVRLATPIEVEPSELSGGAKGLIDYRQQTNFPNPWPGGVWRLRDIMDYERIASDALLEICSKYREDILRGKLDMSLSAIQSGKSGEYYKIPIHQFDPATAAHLAHLMRENGVAVDFNSGEDAFYIATAQPLGNFILEMLEPQHYPKVRPAPGTNILTPYDVTTWSLPLMMGVKVEKHSLTASEQADLRPIKESDLPQGEMAGKGAPIFAISHSSNNASKLLNRLVKGNATVNLAREPFQSGSMKFPAGTLLVEPAAQLESLMKELHLHAQGLTILPSIPVTPLKNVRVGLYKPWVASMDEGWTRWVLEQYAFDVKNFDNKAAKAGNLKNDYDAILLPDVSRDVIVDGKYKQEEGESRYLPDLPPEYAGGIGKEGVENLKKFVEDGGTLVALASSCELMMSEFNIPVSNVLSKVRAGDFNCPGTLLRIHVDNRHPVTYGMPQEAAAFLDEAMALQTTLPGPEVTRHVLASYPDQAEDILLSGWIQGAEKLERKSAAVALTLGKGKIVLLGFRVQHRAQTEGTFKLLFNALHWAGM